MAFYPTDEGTLLVTPTYGAPIEVNESEARTRARCAIPACPWVGEWRNGTAFDEANLHALEHRRGRVPMLYLGERSA